jgi:predicted unusual protein kinase regulating ubiquinone biosynthesis (AarF/ABC1/UbiB family)
MGMIGSSGSLARQSPLRLSPKAVYAMRSTMLPEKIKQNTNTEHKHFIYLDKQLIAIHIKTDTTSTAGTPTTWE